MKSSNPNNSIYILNCTEIYLFGSTLPSKNQRMIYYQKTMQKEIARKSKKNLKKILKIKLNKNKCNGIMPFLVTKMLKMISKFREVFCVHKK